VEKRKGYGHPKSREKKKEILIEKMPHQKKKRKEKPHKLQPGSSLQMQWNGGPENQKTGEERSPSGKLSSERQGKRKRSLLVGKKDNINNNTRGGGDEGNTRPYLKKK